MVAQIERSPGLIVMAGAVPAGIVGGGYHGASDALDQVVDQAAEALRDMFDHPVTIRFNADRQSGGAWLKTSEVDGIDANCEIKIGAQRCDLTEIRKDMERRKARYGWDDNFENCCAERGIDPNGPNEQIRYVSYIKADYLRDPSLATDGEGIDRKSNLRHAMLAEAIAFVREHAVADPRIVTAMRKRRAAGKLAAKVRQTRGMLDTLDKRQLHAIMWRLPYTYRPPHFGFKPTTTKENKATLRAIILRAVRERNYTFEPAHLERRF